jgi:hypothetical protein
MRVGRMAVGVLALSPTLDNMYLAFPSVSGHGRVTLYDTEQLRVRDGVGDRVGGPGHDVTD